MSAYEKALSKEMYIALAESSLMSALNSNPYIIRSSEWQTDDFKQAITDDYITSVYGPFSDITKRQTINVNMLNTGNDASMNHAPEINQLQNNLSFNEKSPWSYQFADTLFHDPDDDVLMYQVVMADGTSLPSWLSFDGITRTLSGTAENEDVGTLNLMIIATDPAGLSVGQSFNVVVNNVNDAPQEVGQLRDQTLMNGQSWQYQLPANSFTDEDLIHGDQLSYFLKMADGSAVPSWLMIDQHSGKLSGMPTQSGLLKVIIVAKDLAEFEATHQLTLIIDEPEEQAILGTENDDLLNGTSGDDIIYGLAGDDKILGGYGHDILEGGTGDDYLEGGSGNDIYRFNKGDGMDTVRDSGGNDRFVFKRIAFAEATFRGENYDLIIDYGEGDAIRIENFFSSSKSYYIESFEFTDRILTLAELQQIKIPVISTLDHLEIYYTGKLELHGDGYLGQGWGDLTAYGGDGDDVLEGASAGNDELHGGHGNDYLRGFAGDDLLYGDEGDDLLYGDAGNDLMDGGAGNDQLYGGTGNDLLIGGTGNDYLEGGSGDDTYYFSQGDGVDRVYDASGNDRIVFSDVAFNAVTFRGENYDLIIDYGQGDFLRIEQFFNRNKNYYIESFEFTDRILTLAELQQIKIPVISTLDHLEIYYAGKLELHGDGYLGQGWGDFTAYGGDGDDILEGASAGNDELHGGAGNDVLRGFAGDDQLFGDAGNDQLYGGDGHDLLVGGTGNDYLEGGYGDDTYLFSKGDGIDTIYDSKGTNRIVFTDVAFDEVTFCGENYDLIIDYGQGDSIRIENFFSSSKHYYMAAFEFTDRILTLAELQQISIPVVSTLDHLEIYYAGKLELHGNGYLGQGWGDLTAYGGDGDDILEGASAGNDALYGGGGNDRLKGFAGNDLLVGGTGDDYMEGGSGHDTYRLSKGDGQDRINDYGASTDQDRVVFTDVAFNEAIFQRDNNDLVIMYGEHDELRIDKYFQSSSYQIHTIEFTDKSLDYLGILEAMEPASQVRTMIATADASAVISSGHEVQLLISAIASFGGRDVDASLITDDLNRIQPCLISYHQ